MSKAIKGGKTTATEQLAGKLLKRLPGGHYAQEQLEKLEHRMLSELKARLDQLAPATSVSVLSVSVNATASAADPSPAERMRQLLARSVEGSREQSGTDFFSAVLRGLLPDEARILSAFSDGSHYPMLRLMCGSKLGPASHCVLDHVSNVGKHAGVSWAELTPVYLSRLATWGLLETGPEDSTLGLKYQILETEDVLRQAMERTRASGQRAVLHRHTVRFSPLGQSLWAACQVEGI